VLLESRCEIVAARYVRIHGRYVTPVTFAAERRHRSFRRSARLTIPARTGKVEGPEDGVSLALKITTGIIAAALVAAVAVNSKASALIESEPKL
jgi:hypothetical protein